MHKLCRASLQLCAQVCTQTGCSVLGRVWSNAGEAGAVPSAPVPSVVPLAAAAREPARPCAGEAVLGDSSRCLDLSVHTSLSESSGFYLLQSCLMVFMVIPNQAKIKFNCPFVSQIRQQLYNLHKTNREKKSDCIKVTAGFVFSPKCRIFLVLFQQNGSHGFSSSSFTMYLMHLSYSGGWK